MINVAINCLKRLLINFAINFVLNYMINYQLFSPGYAEDFNPSGLDLPSSAINITTGFLEDRFE
jgi:hypothetical protein